MRKKEKPENFKFGGAGLCAQTFLSCLLPLCALFIAADFAQGQQKQAASDGVAKKKEQQQSSPSAANSQSVELRILRAEDERRWDAELVQLLTDKNAAVRRRAALAAGRIGDERAITSLVTLLRTDEDMKVRAMAAFALGEVESARGAEGLMAELKSSERAEVRARSIEALGKIAAALPKGQESLSRSIGEALVTALEAERSRKPQPDRETILLGLTALLRARPANGGATIVKFLSDKDARVRADALNTMARLRAKDGIEAVRALLANDSDPIVRANAARVIGAAEDKAAFDALVSRLMDEDLRVRISVIRALASLREARASDPLLARAAKLTEEYKQERVRNPSLRPASLNELLDVATALGRVLSNSWNKEAVAWLRQARELVDGIDPEIEIAFARIAPALYVREKPFDRITDEAARAQLMKDWRRASSVAQALGEIAGLKSESDGNSVVSIKADAQAVLRAMLDDKSLPALAQPDVLRALAAFKPNDLSDILRRQLQARDVVVRATAAELLGELAPEETIARALAEALTPAMRDEMNDAALAILDSLGKQKSETASEALRAGLGSVDHLIRRRAASLLKAGGAGDMASSIGTVQTRNTAPDYQRVMARAGKIVRALIATDKGSFTIELLPEDAPLTVDNFVQLARRGYFNNITFHRVVPNFVIQGGDPRGDGNGGPGYQIRCEINEVPYERGAIGMALSGKDTGGSQWFVTHSPQPHLDGGYTVFARVVEGMEVVDRIARGDRIRNVTVTETTRPASKVVKTGAAKEAPARGKQGKPKEAVREKRKGER